MASPAKPRPLMLDLFSKAGGAAKGYHDAGFDLVGVDWDPQPRYPYCFVQMGVGRALHRLTRGGYIECQHGHRYYLSDFDAIHASPPCQGYSIMRNLPWLRHKKYPLLIPATRARLQAIGLPYIIENVMGAQRKANMQAGWLCGAMFGLPLYRHRVFETNWPWIQPGHPRHEFRIRGGRTLGGRARDLIFTERYTNPNRPKYGFDAVGSGIGKGKGAALARQLMGVEWMKGDEQTQAIPPVMTCFLGTQLLGVMDGA